MPSSKNYQRNYAEEYKTAKARGEVGTGHNSENAIRHRDRRKALELGLVKPKDDLDHKVPLSKGGKSDPANWRDETPHQNRSFPRTRKGALIVNHEKTPDPKKG
jgi:5-methylcytosine-specific restriction endonuclease McrA